METKRAHIAKTFMWGEKQSQKHQSTQLQLHCKAIVKPTKLPANQPTKTHGTHTETKHQWRKNRTRNLSTLL